MAFYSDGTFKQIVEALQRLDPEKLAHESNQQYSNSPSPAFRVLSETDQQIQRKWDLAQSTPYFQFKNQWCRESDRIVHQLINKRTGRRQTLPYDPKLDYDTNAQNNVRNRWKEQGI